jgi:hypothetical protein
MADIAVADVTIIRSWSEGGVRGKDRVGMLVELKNTTSGLAAGGTSNLFPATALGLSVVESVSTIAVYTISTGAPVKMYPAAPTADGSKINSCLAADVTPGNHINVGDFTVSTLQAARLEVHGYRT